jgi:hypothetical protein
MTEPPAADATRVGIARVRAALRVAVDGARPVSAHGPAHRGTVLGGVGLLVAAVIVRGRARS